MKKNPASGGLKTSEKVRARAIEVALSAGRSEQDMSEADWEQARQELSGSTEGDPKQAVLEAVPESERWDPLPGSTGHKITPTPSEDEDIEGRSNQSQLVEEGLSAAEDERTRQSTHETPHQEK